MIKPNNYEKTSDGSFTPIELGGHICRIKKAVESTTKDGKPMLVVYFDFDNGDKQPNYFMEQFSKDIRPEKKWPFAGTKWIVSVDKDGNCSKNFKSFISCVEKSNGFAFKEEDWGDKFCSVLVGKVIGAVYGPSENEYDGKVTTRPELRWFCEASKAEKAAIPELKKLKADNQSPVAGFEPIKDDSIPF